MKNKSKELDYELYKVKQINRILNVELQEIKKINNEMRVKLDSWEYDYNNLKEEYLNLVNKTLKNRIKKTIVGKAIKKTKDKLRGTVNSETHDSSFINSREANIENVPISKINIKQKPRIALIVDVVGWCFWNIANTIVDNLKKYYDFEIIPVENIDNNIYITIFYVQNFDLVHFFWRGHLTFLDNSLEYLYKIGMPVDYFKENYLNKLKITTSVYDHLYLDNLDYTNKIFQYCQNYTVCSKKLEKIYNENEGIIKKPQMTITDGVDLKLFRPKNLQRFKKNQKLVVGWVGNSLWQSDTEDFKGFNTILKPTIDELISKDYAIETCYADKQEKLIIHEEMPNYYAKIDVLVCVSKIEGTPNPVLEAMACGVPIISTNVGIVKDALGPKQKEFILKKRDKDSLSKAILKLLNNRDILEDLSQENLERIKKWDWSIKVQEFKKFFDRNLSRCNNEITNKKDN